MATATIEGVCQCGCNKPTPIAPRTYGKYGIKKGEYLRFLPGHRIRPSAKDRLLKNVRQVGKCWIWTGSRGRGGDEEEYGKIWFDGRSWVASRLSYFLFVGDIPEGMLVCHSCDTPGCIRPEHLFLGNHTINAKDAAMKRRCGAQRRPEAYSHLHGEGSPNAKLKELRVKTIKRLIVMGYSHDDIALRCGVNRSTVSKIGRGERWATTTSDNPMSAEQFVDLAAVFPEAAIRLLASEMDVTSLLLKNARDAGICV